MATRDYYIRYSPWNTTPFGEQFIGAYLLTVPVRIVYQRSTPSSINNDKKNTYSAPVQVDIDSNNEWGGALLPDEAPAPEDVLTPRGVMPPCTYRTLSGNSEGAGSLTDTGNLDYSLGGYSWYVDGGNFCSMIAATSKQDYVDAGWANDINSIDSLRDNLITWCTNNIQYTFWNASFENALWESVNIVIDPTTWEHLIYIGNDPISTYSTSVADTGNSAVTIASLDDWS